MSSLYLMGISEYQGSFKSSYNIKYYSDKGFTKEVQVTGANDAWNKFSSFADKYKGENVQFIVSVSFNYPGIMSASNSIARSRNFSDMRSAFNTLKSRLLKAPELYQRLKLQAQKSQSRQEPPRKKAQSALSKAQVLDSKVTELNKKIAPLIQQRDGFVAQARELRRDAEKYNKEADSIKSQTDEKAIFKSVVNSLR